MLKQILLAFLLLISGGFILFVDIFDAIRPTATFQASRPLFRGITYGRQVRNYPRPLVLHYVTVDLTDSDIQLITNPGVKQGEKYQFAAQTTGDFAQEFNVQLAINAGFFYPIKYGTPWQFYPQKGDYVNVVGQAIAQGVEYEPAKPDWPALCVGSQNDVSIEVTGECPKDTEVAIAGSLLLLDDGNAIAFDSDAPNNENVYPRIAVGLNRDRTQLWIVIIDGRQPHYSEGVTLAEFSEILSEFDINAAINLDGGGSTTLVSGHTGKIQALNSPIHSRIPMYQRPIATHFGIYAAPLD